MPRNSRSLHLKIGPKMSDTFDYIIVGAGSAGAGGPPEPVGVLSSIFSLPPGALAPARRARARMGTIGAECAPVEGPASSASRASVQREVGRKLREHAALVTKHVAFPRARAPVQADRVEVAGLDVTPSVH